MGATRRSKRAFICCDSHNDASRISTRVPTLVTVRDGDLGRESGRNRGADHESDRRQGAARSSALHPTRFELRGIACPDCRARTFVQVDTDSQCAENLAAFILLALAIIPGIAYFFDRTRMPRCTTCRRRVRFV